MRWTAMVAEQGWSEKPLLQLAGVIGGIAIVIIAIRWMFDKR